MSKFNKGDIITDGVSTVLITNITNSLYVFYAASDIHFQDIEEVDMDPSIRLANPEEVAEWKAKTL